MPPDMAYAAYKHLVALGPFVFFEEMKRFMKYSGTQPVRAAGA